MKKAFSSLLLALFLTIFSAAAVLAQEIIIANDCDFPLHGLAMV